MCLRDFVTCSCDITDRAGALPRFLRIPFLQIWALPGFGVILLPTGTPEALFQRMSAGLPEPGPWAQTAGAAWEFTCTTPGAARGQ